MKYCIIPVVPFNQNCSLVWCDITNEAALIDPGGDYKKICEQVDKLEVKVTKILLTHGHVDHVAGAMKVKRYYNVPIIGPNKGDQLLLNNLFIQCCVLGINFFYDSIVYPDVWLKDHDKICIGHEVFDVLFCPGHSPGHVVFWNKKCKFVIMGDLMFRGSIGRTDLPGGNISVLLHSIKTKLFPLGDDVCFLPGHGKVSSIGYERLNNRFLF